MAKQNGQLPFPFSHWRLVTAARRWFIGKNSDPIFRHAEYSASWHDERTQSAEPISPLPNRLESVGSGTHLIANIRNTFDFAAAMNLPMFDLFASTYDSRFNTFTLELLSLDTAIPFIPIAPLGLFWAVDVAKSMFCSKGV